MKAKRVVVIVSVWALWAIAFSACSPFAQAQNEESPATQEHHDHTTPAAEGAPMAEHHHDMGSMSPEEHAGGHHHRPAILPPDEDKAYSELNHHIAGVFVLFAGALALLAAVGGRRFAWARYGWPGLFFLLGIFLFVATIQNLGRSGR